MTVILILAVVGVLLVLAEIVLPGGILGIIGALCLIAAVVMAFVKYGAGVGLIAFVGLVIFGFIMTWAWMKYFHRLPFTKKLVLNESIESNETEREEKNSLIGQTGEALTDLMPSGRARIGESKVDVISQSGAIDKGATVEVVDVQGPSVIVVEA